MRTIKHHCYCLEHFRKKYPDVQGNCLEMSCGRYRIEMRKKAEEMDAVGINIGGLKCDTPTCDYQDMTVKFEDYPKMIDAPCPKCGASLLTQKDYETTQQMVNLVKRMNKILPPANPNEPKVSVPMELNGTGKLTLKLEEMKIVE